MFDDPLLSQAVNRRVFDDIMIQFFKQQQERGGSERNAHAQADDTSTLSVDEQNALRMAAGYVMFKLLAKYTKKEDDKSDEIVRCLKSFSKVDDDACGDDGTRWISKIDKGGLFKVNDAVFRFFENVEALVRKSLRRRLSRKEVDIDVVASVLENEVILDKWVSLSCLSNAKVRLFLLRDITELWVTMRGYSLTSAWLEQYKNEKRLLLKKKKSLRKNLIPV